MQDVGGGSPQIQFVDAQTLAHPPKAELLVQRECGEVVGWCVDQHPLHAPQGHPVQRIQHEGAAQAGTLLAGGNSQPLEKALLGVTTTEGVRAEGRAGPASTESWRGRAHLCDGAWLQPPVLREGGHVDGTGRCVMAGDQSLGGDGLRRAFACGPSGAGRVARVGVFQKDQLLDHLEAGGFSAQCSGYGEGGRANGGVTHFGEALGPVLQVDERRQALLVIEHQLGNLWLERPSLHAARDPVAMQDQRYCRGVARIDSAATRRAVRGPATHCPDGSCWFAVRNFAAAARPIASLLVTVLFATHAAYLEHLAGPRHPERPERLQAVLDGVHLAGLNDAIVPLDPLAATRGDLERVHPVAYLDRIEGICAAGGGRLDSDTYASAGSWTAATLAAGAGLTAVRALQEGRGDAAFCAVRPPGHHATRDASMGFCFVNNVAVVAASLADQGERVMIFDYDAHHGNGTQAVFYHDPRVLFVSLHQWPLYPGTGRHTEVGEGAARGMTVNVPLPPGATGDVYLAAFDELVAPIADRFAPTWIIVSAGFDAHRNDPITELALAAGDYAPLTQRVLSLVAPGRRLVMLEGGYDLDALTVSSATVLREMAGEAGAPIEASTSGGPGLGAVRRAYDFWDHEGLLDGPSDGPSEDPL